MPLVEGGYSLKDWVAMWVATFLPWRVVRFCAMRWEERHGTVTFTIDAMGPHAFETDPNWVMEGYCVHCGAAEDNQIHG